MFRTVLKISGNVNMAGKSEQLAAPMEPTKAGSRNWSANWRRSVANATFLKKALAIFGQERQLGSRESITSS